MSDQSGQVCPWCQTEIVWDPEIGPEETCPHCFNELGEYRSIRLEIGKSGQKDGRDEDYEEEEDEEDYFDEDLETDSLDAYEEGAQRVLDTQEEAPECPSCRSFMLLAGTQSAAPSFVPFVHETVKEPIVKADYSAQVYVCPSCFRVETILSEKDRLSMMELLKRS